MTDNFFDLLRERLKAAIDSGVSQTQISKESGVQQGSISRLLKASQTISGEALVKLVNWLDGEIILTKPTSIPAHVGDDEQLNQEQIDALKKALKKEREARIHLEGEVAVLERLLEKSQKQIQEQARELSFQKASERPNSGDKHKTLKVV